MFHFGLISKMRYIFLKFFTVSSLGVHPIQTSQALLELLHITKRDSKFNKQKTVLVTVIS